MKSIHILAALFIICSSMVLAEDYVYVLPDGRVQWGPNIHATKTKLSDLPDSIQRDLLEQRKNLPTMRERLEAFSARFRCVLADNPATSVRVLLVCDTEADGGIVNGVAVDLA